MNFLTPKVPGMMYCAALQFKPLKIIEKIIFEMAGGGHFEFEALTELAHIFARACGLNFLFNLHKNKIH